MDTTEPRPEDELTALERRLGRWQPTPAGLNRDRMLFEAGRAAARAEVWGRVPLASAAALALVVAGLGMLLVRERDQRHALEIRLVQQTTNPRTTAPLIETEPLPIVERTAAPDSYLVLTHKLLAIGVDDALLQAPSATQDNGSPTTEPPLRVRGPGGLLNF